MENPASGPAAAPASRRDVAVVVATIAVAAMFLWAFLIVSHTALVVALLVVLAGGFWAMERHPAWEDAIVASFGRARTTALVIGTAVALAYPLAFGQNTTN